MNTNFSKDTHKALAFDLDGTLAESKSDMTVEMGKVLASLLSYIPLAFISGASKDQFMSQCIQHIQATEDQFKNLYLFPENGASLYLFQHGGWVPQYEENLSSVEKEKIMSVLSDVIRIFGLHEIDGFGPLVEDRGAQVTLSCLGQHASLEAKSSWDPDQNKRREMLSYIQPLLPEFQMKMGGATSIDITRKGIDKNYALTKYMELLSLSKSEILYYGDAIFPGGNDYIVEEFGYPYVHVHNPQETLDSLRGILVGYEEATRREALG